MADKTVRTRFAPSPTGFLHVGGVRTALFNYLYAKKQGGQFILRLEDTDRERFVAEGVEQVVESLEWLGLKPDEGFWISEGKHQNIDFVQSERHARGFYQKFADKLVEKGLAYYSPTSKEELEKLREQSKKEKRPFLYRKELDSKNSSEPQKDTPIRLDIAAFYEMFMKNSNSKEAWLIKWGEPTSREPAGWHGHLVEDFILIKSDGFPTYNFANVVDDHDMEITDVMRGNEFFASTPKHIMLYRAFGWQPPNFCHLSVINGTDGKKLSKRTGDTNVLDYRDKGYPPDALLNFLALLGWNDGTEQEIFSRDELIKKFSLEHINSSPAIFDQKRLDWISGNHIREMDLNKLFDSVEGFWPQEAEEASSEYKKQVLGLAQERLKYFAELPELTRFFFTELPVNPELIAGSKQLQKFSSEELRNLLEQAKAVLEKSNFTVQELTEELNKLLEQTGQKPGVLFSLIRIATTQAAASPALADTMAVLGKETSLKRIEKQIAAL